VVLFAFLVVAIGFRRGGGTPAAGVDRLDGRPKSIAFGSAAGPAATIGRGVGFDKAATALLTVTFEIDDLTHGSDVPAIQDWRALFARSPQFD
jgi:hypothetical protein